MMGSGDEVRITIPDETRYLGVIRRVVTAVATKAGFTALEAGEIEVAVDEIASCAVQDTPGGGAIVLRARITTVGLELCVTAPAHRTFDEAVVRACVDEVEPVSRPASGRAELRLRRFRGRERPV